ncbi:PaaI family thioesterase [Tropicibacter naphthalenivorans]|uniref:Putative domain 1 n=1 Tax=Tropicibacter naphthalenivorans TaxID=441103 RepID=A0A0N7LZN7_9RHOB|nr:PaaI family thioesterase [Tropicibacter naphthalenivorans]CUH78177.1 putative domain 1 [Tropicibacter naphthalenivorans]SMC93217.1 uncharacterized domain 1-containing protein [Tropicibacter naphthalenivorans]
MSYDHLLAAFDSQTMMTSIGASVADVATGAVTLTAPIGEGFRQHHGFGHAGLTFALGDTAGGFAAMTLLPADQAVVTSEIKIHLLSPAIGERLIARGKVVKPGKRLIVVMSEVFAVNDGVEKQIALLTGTMIPVPA